MTIAVRYQSRGGNTKSTAEAIAKAAGVAAEPIDTPLPEPVDLLIVGGGVYKWGLGEELVAYLESLDPAAVKQAAVFTTASGMDKTSDMAKILTAKGVAVHPETLAVKFLAKNHAWFGAKGYVDLSDKQLAAVNAFVEKVTLPAIESQER